MYETFKVWVKRKEGKQRVEVVARQVVIIIIATTTRVFATHQVLLDTCYHCLLTGNVIK